MTTRIPQAPAAATAVLTALLLGLGGCGSDSADDSAAPTATPTPTTPAPSTQSHTELSIDATAGGFRATADNPANKFTYVNLKTASVVELSDAAAASSTDWHIAFKRTQIKLNGGTSGPGTVTAGVADDQAEYYSNGEPNASVFLNANAASELASFEAVSDISNIRLSADGHQPAITGDGGTESWWFYNSTTHALSANPDIWNIVRGSAGDSYAKVRASSIDTRSFSIRFDLQIQNPGETAFDTNAVDWTANLGSAGKNACFDFDTRAEVDCTDAAARWDLMVAVSANARSWSLWSNSGKIRGAGTSGASFGPINSADIGSYASASAAPTFFSDSASSIMTTNSWYAYSLQGDNKLWPNYRIYAINTGDSRHKLQILSFYNAAGTSGMYSLRMQTLP